MPEQHNQQQWPACQLLSSSRISTHARPPLTSLSSHLCHFCGPNALAGDWEGEGGGGGDNGDGDEWGDESEGRRGRKRAAREAIRCVCGVYNEDVDDDGGTLLTYAGLGVHVFAMQALV